MVRVTCAGKRLSRKQIVFDLDFLQAQHVGLVFAQDPPNHVQP
jgi:hypothetical protein